MTLRALGRRVAAPVIALIPACFHPTFDHPACPDHVCPGGWTCNEATGFCDPALGDGGGPPDARSVDAPSGSDGGPDAQACFGTGLVRVCLASAPSAPVILNPGGPIDTSVDASCTQIVPGGTSSVSEMCVIAGTTVTVPGNVVAIGPRPLVVIATDTLSVSATGILDVSSRTGTSARRGAGANSGTCNAPTTAADDTGGGGGGAGGSFGTRGGTGGTGDLNNNGPPNGTAIGGTAGAAQPAPAKLRGGCRGGEGGAGDGPAQHRAVGGDGGGAIYLIAGISITIDGSVYASGGGGGADADATGIEQGGGGGGSGGMIGLDAPSITVAGRVVANGGAGGGGGATTTGGSRGGEGTTINWSTRAAGGAGSAGSTGNGGSGAAGTAVGQAGNVDGIDSDGGAGGGAGGLGVILIYGVLGGGTMMSPSPTLH